jgi:polyphosphate kinase 2 (PPK2 family)
MSKKKKQKKRVVQADPVDPLPAGAAPSVSSDGNKPPAAPPQQEEKSSSGVETSGRRKKLSKKFYEKELARLQVELVKLQEWVKYKGLKVVVIFEGRDAAGKGGVIKRITERLNPRVARVVALPAPTERERTQWYFQRYIAHLPTKGEMTLFDRSWYNRAGVEPVMGFCSLEQHSKFLREVPQFEPCSSVKAFDCSSSG